MKRQSQRSKWLAERRTGIGGSDAAAILGVSKRKTALHVWSEKMGLSEDFPSTERMKMGLRMEKAILQEYQSRVKCKMVYPSAKGEVLRHPDLPFLLGSLDAIASKGSERWVVDAKNVDWMFSESWGADGSGKAPEDLVVQVLHYMMVGGFPKADLAALFGGNTLRIVTIHRDDNLIAKMRELEIDFWNKHVVSGVPPAPDFQHPATADVIKTLNGSVEERTVTFTPTKHLAFVLEAFHLGSKLESKGRNLKTAAKNELVWLMGSANRAEIDGTGFSITRKLVKKEAYSVEATSYVDTRVKMPKGLELPEPEFRWAPTAITHTLIGDENDDDIIDADDATRLLAENNDGSGSSQAKAE